METHLNSLTKDDMIQNLEASIKKVKEEFQNIEDKVLSKKDVDKDHVDHSFLEPVHLLERKI